MFEPKSKSTVHTPYRPYIPYPGHQEWLLCLCWWQLCLLHSSCLLDKKLLRWPVIELPLFVTAPKYEENAASSNLLQITYYSLNPIQVIPNTLFWGAPQFPMYAVFLLEQVPTNPTLLNSKCDLDGLWQLGISKCYVFLINSLREVQGPWISSTLSSETQPHSVFPLCQLSNLTCCLMVSEWLLQLQTSHVPLGQEEAEKGSNKWVYSLLLGDQKLFWRPIQ